MLKNIKIFMRVLIIVSFIILPQAIHAETHVYSYNAEENWTWNKASSPYILEEPLYVPHGYKLTVEEGVEVISAPVDEDTSNQISIDGILDIRGTKENPVKFSNLYSINFSNSTSYITHAIFDKTGLDFGKSTSTISYINIHDSFHAITSRASRLMISSSTIDHNSYGIVSNLQQSIFQANSNMPNTGGIGNAISDIFDTLDSKQNIISVNNSSIIDNTYYGVLNETLNSINATNNWWGRKEGPSIGYTLGLVNIDPWLLSDPNIIMTQVCCSNVLFIPGFEASRLYTDTKDFFGTTTNTLWEPNRNDDVLKIYMDKNGQSVDKSIYTKDIIDIALNTKNIYESFINNMNDLVKDNIINNWLPFPYDWRKNIYDVVDNSLIDKVRDLANKSKDKKIIIIAHSNGGLIAKRLVKNLEEKGFNNIVENIIYIAVPELGTPEAVLSMLHGHNQGIAFGAILSKNNARNFSKNLPGAYGLLPSKKFFEQNSINIISDLFNNNFQIFSFDSMKNFLVNNIFSSSTTNNTSIPILLNQNLFPSAEEMHSSLDNWRPSSTTKTMSIFGWGLPTSIGVIYKKDPHCNQSIQYKCALETLQSTNKSGDGTVITKSNSKNSNSVFYFDLDKANSKFSKKINHANILESSHLLSFINDQINKTKSLNSDYDKYFSTAEPIDDSMTVQIRIHSPVDINIYDDQGRHTGIIKNPDTGSDLSYLQDDIPSVYLDDFANVKTAIIPLGADLKIELTGNNVGTFIVDTELRKGSTVIATSSFSELPIIPSTQIDLIIGSTTETFASTTLMQIDIDGDDLTDFISHTNTYLQATDTNPVKDLPVYIESMKKIIISIDLSPIQKKYWLSRIDKIVNYIEKNKYRKVEKYIKKLIRRKGHDKSISESQKRILLDSFEFALSYLEDIIVIDSKPKH